MHIKKLFQTRMHMTKESSNIYIVFNMRSQRGFQPRIYVLLIDERELDTNKI